MTKKERRKKEDIKKERRHKERKKEEMKKTNKIGIFTFAILNFEKG